MRASPRPCANCARPATASSPYCSPLCRQVADAVRCLRAWAADGRLAAPDNAAALGLKLALISSGGYSHRPLTARRRAAVIERDEGRCRSCGAPGREVDHIDGPSDDVANLQLLCTACHAAKTRRHLVPARAATAGTVHRPIRLRGTAECPVQPCDIPRWAFRSWARPDAHVRPDALVVVEAWGRRAPPLTPAAAALGFPPELDPWAWYCEPDHGTSVGGEIRGGTR